MIKKITLYTLSSVIMLTGCASTQHTTKIQSNVKPASTVTTCELKYIPDIYTISHEAMHAKRQSMPKFAMHYAIKNVEKNVWKQKLMEEILHEIYDYPVLNSKIYTTYRGEICYQQITNPQHKAYSNYKKAYPLLKKCEQDTDKDQIICAMKAVHTVFNIQAK